MILKYYMKYHCFNHPISSICMIRLLKLCCKRIKSKCRAEKINKLLNMPDLAQCNSLKALYHTILFFFSIREKEELTLMSVRNTA